MLDTAIDTMANIESKLSQLPFSIEIVAENALLLNWPQEIAIAQHNQIIALQILLNKQLPNLIIDAIASYHSLMIYYDFNIVNTEQIIRQIVELFSTNTQHGNLENKQNSTDIIEIPVYYDHEHIWDLYSVAKQCQMTANEVIKLHSSTTYRSYALGFTPGFCYLASLPKALQLARKSSPRTKVPKGAVAIAEQQTAIYPNESPGGWHIIGQTPLPMYQALSNKFTPTIAIGQSVRFNAISKAEFLAFNEGKTQ